MDHQPLFRELRLSLASDQDVAYALDVLEGRSTVSQVAEQVGQDDFSFNGDGDILILSYSRDRSATKETEARRVLAERGNEIVCDLLVPALYRSKAKIELVLRCCNLSTETVILLATAIKANTSLVGFNVSGNPANRDEVGKLLLDRACVETLAPLKWYQGYLIPESLLEKREDFAHSRMVSVMEDSRFSPRTMVAQLEYLAKSTNNYSSESAEDTLIRRRISRKGSSTMQEENERIRWRRETRSRLQRLHPSYTEGDLSDIIANLEMLKLQETIDKLVFDPIKENDNPAATVLRKNSFTFSSDPLVA